MNYDLTDQPLPRLSKQQARFLEELQTLPLHERSDRDAQNAAAARAGYKFPRAMVPKLMRNRAIRAALMSQVEVAKTLRQGVDDAWVLHELAELWETPLSDLFDEDGALLPIHRMSTQAQKLIAAFDVRTEFEAIYDDEGNVTHERVMRVVTSKIKLINRLDALKTIGATTKVNAFGDKEKSEAAGAFADLLKAATAAAQRGEPIDIDAIRKEIKDGDR